MAPVLSLQSIERSFGGVRALSGISLELQAGTVTGLMGDNGAGKSTLVKIIAGNFRPTAGALSINGTPAQFNSPFEARQAGIEVVYQDLALCDNLTATANIFLGRELTRGPFGWLRNTEMRARAVELLAELESDTNPDALVSELSGGQRQAVAIARVLLANPKIVLLDEPTAAISVRQVEQVLNVIRKLRQRGVAVVLISHRMPDIFAVCDKLVVLRRGAKVCDKPVSQSSPNEVTALITGALDAA